MTENPAAIGEGPRTACDGSCGPEHATTHMALTGDTDDFMTRLASEGDVRFADIAGRAYIRIRTLQQALAARLADPPDREGQVAGIAAALHPIMYDPDWPGVADFTDEAQKLYGAGLRIAGPGGRAAGVRTIESVIDMHNPGVNWMCDCGDHEYEANERPTFNEHVAGVLYDAGLRLASERADPVLDVPLDAMYEKAHRWRDQGMFTDAEWAAICAVFYVKDVLTPAERERAIELGQRTAARLAGGAGHE